MSLARTLVVQDARNGGSRSIAVLILNWNGRENTLACLRSLFALNRPDVYAVVVDNGSSDGSEAAILEEFPEVRLLQTGANLGYAGGNNVGIRDVLGGNAQYLFILNNDTIVGNDLFEPLLELSGALNHRGVLGPLTYTLGRPSELQFGGVRWEQSEFRFRRARDTEVVTVQGLPAVRTDYVQGSALFAPVDVFRTVGEFDERFFLTYEETDWCYRARAKGFTCWIAQRARLEHDQSPSFGGRRSPLYEYFVARNELLWAEMHHGRAVALQRCLKPLYWELNRRASAAAASRRVDFAKGSAKWLGPFGALVSALREPGTRAMLAGTRDYLLRRFGDCPRSVRSMKVNR